MNVHWFMAHNECKFIWGRDNFSDKNGFWVILIYTGNNFPQTVMTSLNQSAIWVYSWNSKWCNLKLILTYQPFSAGAAFRTCIKSQLLMVSHCGFLTSRYILQDMNYFLVLSFDQVTLDGRMDRQWCIWAKVCSRRGKY